MRRGRGGRRKDAGVSGRAARGGGGGPGSQVGATARPTARGRRGEVLRAPLGARGSRYAARHTVLDSRPPKQRADPVCLKTASKTTKEITAAGREGLGAARPQ